MTKHEADLASELARLRAENERNAEMAIVSLQKATTYKQRAEKTEAALASARTSALREAIDYHQDRQAALQKIVDADDTLISAERYGQRIAGHNADAQAIGDLIDQPVLNPSLASAAQAVVDARRSSYTARNNKQVTIESGDGEKCWIVPFEEMHNLETALAHHLWPDRNSGSPASQDVLAERSRQAISEGFDGPHDDQNTEDELARAAICYILGNGGNWPVQWDRKWWKPADRRRNLVKAAALLVAEIERLDRASAAKSPGGS